VMLQHPFESARGLLADARGRVALVDGCGKVLAYVPLDTAHRFARFVTGNDQHYDRTGCKGGYGWGYRQGDGCGGGDGDGEGCGLGYGYGYSLDTGEGP
jgi:hypothetical protein